MQFLDRIDGLSFLSGELIFKKDIPEDAFSLDELKAFLVFFKIKEENYKELFEEKRAIENKIKACLFKFDEFQIDIDKYQVRDLVPFHVIESLARTNNKVYSTIIKDIKSKNGFELFFKYYKDNKECFDILPRLECQFRFGQVKLAFAENFRFKAAPNSFNFFNLRKELRHLIYPDTEDYILYSVDYKQFEFRAFLQLIDYDKSIFSDNLYEQLGLKFGLSTEIAKQSIIAWLYSDKKNEVIDPVLDKRKLLHMVSNGLFMGASPPIFVGEGEANNKNIHSIVQTTAQFFYLKKLVEILKMLEGKKSQFVFPLHDSMVFFLHKSELSVMKQINAILENDVHKVKHFIGMDYKELQEI